MEVKKDSIMEEDAYSAEDKLLLQQVAAEIVRRRLATPAIFFLESVKPVNFIGSQVMHFFTPIVSLLFDFTRYQRFAELLERRESLELLIQEIENQEEERSSNPKAS